MVPRSCAPAVRTRRSIITGKHVSACPHLLSRRAFLAAVGAASAGALFTAPPTSAVAQIAGAAPAGPLELSLSEVADRLRRRKLSSVEVTRACLDRIGTLNPALNAFITVTSETA